MAHALMQFATADAFTGTKPLVAVIVDTQKVKYA